jgi:hypothetical protein
VLYVREINLTWVSSAPPVGLPSQGVRWGPVWQRGGGGGGVRYRKKLEEPGISLLLFQLRES